MKIPTPRFVALVGTSTWIGFLLAGASYQSTTMLGISSLGLCAAMIGAIHADNNLWR